MSARDPAPRLVATEAAQQAIISLRAVHGPLMFVQSAGCCGGSAPMCFQAGEFITAPCDVLVGDVTGCPFYMDERQYAAWHTDQLILDIDPGMAEGFSLPADGGWHFVTRSVLCIRDDDPVRDCRNGAAPRSGPA